MTTVRILKDGIGYKSFECCGHAGYASEGEDIVCASVSAATDLVIDIFESLSVGFDLEIDEEKAYVKCTVKENNSSDAVNGVLDGYCRYLKDVSAAYPENLECILTEV